MADFEDRLPLKLRQYFFVLGCDYIDNYSLSIILTQSSEFVQRLLVFELIKKRRITSQMRSLSFSLQFGENYKISQRTLLQFVKSYKHLQSFYLRSHLYDGPCSEILQTISKALRNCRNLRKLHLYFAMTKPASQQLNAIASFLSKLRLLAPKVRDFELTLGFVPHSSIAPPLIYNSFAKMAKGFKFLTSLALDLSTLFFKDSRPKSNALDFSSLKALNNIRDLNITFYNKEEVFLHHNAQILPYKAFRKLRDLKVTIHEGSVPISFASQMAANLPKLKNISLVLFYSEFTERKYFSEKEFGKLTAELSLGIKHLTFLSLILPKITFTTSTASSLFSLFLCEKFRNLQTLSLDFPQCHYFSNFAMEQLGESTSANLGNIKEFSFSITQAKPSNLVAKAWKNVFHRDDISDTGLVQFGKAITQKPSKNLEYFRFNVENCPKISDEGVKQFCGKLGLIKSLKRVLLSFENCEKVTIKSFKNVQWNGKRSQSH